MSDPNRPTTELAAAVRRLTSAIARRAAAGDDGAAVALVYLASNARREATAGLAGAHRAGWSYAELALLLGVSRQAVAQRIGRAEGQRLTEPAEPGTL